MRTWTWNKFAKRVRRGNTPLLSTLSDYQTPILIAGCQRSGGTMLASVISKHPEVVDPFWSKDAELDAALMLSGAEPNPHPDSDSRYCFQTTYLNEQYIEYINHAENFRLIWLIRNPHSVVYSMVHNWRRFALNEVFLACGIGLAPEEMRNRHRRFGMWAIKPIERASYAYLGKMAQCKVLLEKLSEKSMTTVDYDDLVTAPKLILPKLLAFAGLSEIADTGAEIRTNSLDKANRLSDREATFVNQICLDEYKAAQKYLVKVRVG